MDLYLFPSAAVKSNGYGIAVYSDYLRFSPKKEDIVVWFSSNPESELYNSEHYFIPRPSMRSFRRVMKVLCNKMSCELNQADLKRIKIDFDRVDKVFCGDVIFYNAIRHLFPNKKIVVRFHNCFARIYDRTLLLKLKSNIRFYINMKALHELESQIFKDENVYKIFISDEDRDYYSLMMGRFEDSEVWGFSPQTRTTFSPINFSNKLVWFGGLETHKIDSVKWFIDDVLPEVRKALPNIEFHLWGRGTEFFNNPCNKIFGNGFYSGCEMPYKSEALYINPDLVGGGVKIKLLTYFNDGVAFISTPFGFEGYKRDLIDGKYCSVVEPSKWAEYIVNLFLKQ